MSHVLLILAALLPNGRPDPVPGPQIVRQVRFIERVTCDSRSGEGALRDVEIRIAVPSSNDRQTIESLKYTPKPDRFVTDDHGNKFAVFTIEHMAAGKSVQVGWTARVRLRQIAHQVKPSALRPLSEVPADIREAYLGRAPKYGMDDADVRAAAVRIGKASKDPLDLAFRINEHLRARLTYRNDGRWENADQVLKNRHGSCSEYNFAFIALARLNGLPARYVGASAMRGDARAYEDKIHHRWTEVYLPGYGWFPVDASRNDGEDGGPVNQWFGKTDARLLVLMKGDGGRSHPLGWGYVAKVIAKRTGDAIARTDKRFLWDHIPVGSLETRNGR